MPTWLLPLAKFFTALMGFVKDALLIKAGKDMQVKADNQKVLEIKNEQLESAANAITSDDDLLARLRNPKDGL